METMLLTALSAVAAKIARCCVEPILEPIGQWLCYPFKYNSNIETLENKVRSLKMTRDSVQHSIDSAKRNGEEIEVGVDTWLKDVKKTIEEATQVLQVKEMGHTWRSIEACLKLVPRHQLSSKAKKIMEDIDVLVEERGKFGNFSYLQEETVTPRHRDYVDFESRISTVKRLKEALRNDKIHMIGVWGMPGVGKTTLVAEVKRQAKEEKLFDEVALANVTNNSDFSSTNACDLIRRIQGEIADALRLKFVEETVPGRARRLWERLSQDRNKHVILDDRLENPDLEESLTKTEDKKKILIILDDIWENLDLKAIGIPSEGCKVLLASRNRDVLVCEMRTQEDFELKVLPEKEAWSLFEKMAGDCFNIYPNLRCVATEIVKECAGLPLALVTIAKALKNKKIFEWKDALDLLRSPAPDVHLTKIQSKIYSPIELSYKHLESKEVQDVFLLCSQLGYYIHETDLLKYCYGLDLFPGIKTMEAARNRLYTILRILKDCCLLLHSPYSSESLHMHDVVRDAANLIASRDHYMLVVRDDGELKEWPDANALKKMCDIFCLW